MNNNFVKFHGRLGNNLFQFSAGVKTYGLTPDGKPDFRAAIGEKDESLYCRRLLPDVEIVADKWVTESGYNWLGYSISNKRNAYFQDLKYCLPPDEMRKLITLPEWGGARPLCVVHIRGGDYRTLPLFENLITTRGFILEALDRLGVHPRKCVIATDDAPFAKTLLPEGMLSGLNSFGELSCMMAAHNLVMSPSTYSWWAGYLGRQKRIIMPDLFPCFAPGLGNDPYSAKTIDGLLFDRCEVVSLRKYYSGRYKLFKRNRGGGGYFARHVRQIGL